MAYIEKNLELGMRIYSLRNLLICFAIVIVVVLWVAFYTFSNLRSQEKELAKITHSHELLHAFNDAASDMQDFESQRTAKGGETALTGMDNIVRRLRNDSLHFAHFALDDTAYAASYYRLSGLIHQLITLASYDKNRSGTALIDEFKAITTGMEDRSRTMLNRYYDHNVAFTRRAIASLIIIVGILALFMIISFSFVYYDIKGRKVKENQLREFNAGLEKQVTEKTGVIREVFERVSDAFVALDKNWRFTYINRKAGEVLGRDPQELLGKHAWEEFAEAKDGAFHHAQQRAMATQQYTYLEEYFPPFDRWYENHIYPSADGLSVYFRDITERKKAEQTLAANEQQLAQIYNSATDIIFSIAVEKKDGDRKFRFTTINKAFLQATGLEEKDITGKYVEEIVPEPALQLVLYNYNQAIHKKSPVQWEEVSDYPAGRKIGIVTVNPVFNDQGECTVLVGVVHDITDRKKAEQELIVAESKFRTLVEQSLIGVYIIQDGKFAYVNPRFAQIFGYRQEELINANPVSVITPADRMMVAQNVRARVEGEIDSIHYEATGMRKDGQTVYLEIYCSGTLYEKSSAIIGTLLDITERKKADQAIIEANERFSLIAKATNDVVWDWDMVNDINRGNDIFYSYYGMKPGTPMKNEEFLSRVHPEDRDRIVERLQKVLEKKEDVVIDEFRFRMPDGTYRYFYDRAYIIYNKKGVPVRMLGSMMDITEKRQLEEEILNQRIQAQKMITRAVFKAEERERNKIGQELHDNVNQILVSIKLFLGMLATGKNPEKSEQLLSNSVSLTETAIQEIRSLSQSYVTPLRESSLDELVKLLLYKIRDSGTMRVKFGYNVDGNIIEDDLKLTIYRIIQEQVSNVLKHADASELQININAMNGLLHISIADDGKGFDITQKRRGIGISNMINRIETFNGELTITSAQGRGCTLDINIPVMANAE